jgi:hypothetical protein
MSRTDTAVRVIPPLRPTDITRRALIAMGCDGVPPIKTKSSFASASATSKARWLDSVTSR